VLLEGHPDDVEAQTRTMRGSGFTEVAGPPAAPGRARLSVPPGHLRALSISPAAVGGHWLAQVGIGSVQAEDPGAVAAAMGVSWPPVMAPGVAQLHRELKRRFDPEGRLNPGRQVAPA
jgi:hypothetical protein